MRSKPTRRGGFTLIEILVVITIIAILTALSVGAFFRVRSAQQTSNSQGTLSKLDTLMMARWSAVLAQAKSTVPPVLVDFCDSDKDRATALWTYMVLKNEFPQSYAEVAPITINGTTLLQPRKVFQKVTTTATTNTNEQSAALFYTAIMETGNRGSSNSADGLEQQKSTTASGLSVFVDSWGTPIVFMREAQNTEIQAAPYSKKTAANTSNPLDPRALLLNWTNATNIALVNAANISPFIFTNRNFVPTLISAGPDKDYGTGIGLTTGDAATDNLLSYRRREGARKD